MKQTNYHRDIFFEEGIEDEVKSFISSLPNITFSYHFIQNAMGKRKNIIKPFTVLKQNLLKGSLFEYTKDEEGKLVKFCIRCLPDENKKSVCYVISNTGNVITAWTNRASDNHKTLHRENYFGGI